MFNDPKVHGWPILQNKGGLRSNIHGWSASRKRHAIHISRSQEHLGRPSQGPRLSNAPLGKAWRTVLMHTSALWHSVALMRDTGQPSG